MSSGFRVSIPNSVRKTIQNIKEIAGNHSDDEIYAMLKECSMDPNETAQKLLHQDTFHEVRRKRDRRKENVNSREPADSRWRPGMQGRGIRGGRGSYSSRYVSYDAGGGRNPNAGKEDGDKGATSTSPISQEAENNAPVPISSMVSGLANGPTNVAHGDSSHGCASQVSGDSDVSAAGENSIADVGKKASALSLPADVKNCSASLIRGVRGPSTPNSGQILASMTQASVSGVYSSASDPVLVPSIDSRAPGVVGTIKREVGTHRTTVEPTNTVAAEIKHVSPHFANRVEKSKLISHDTVDSELSMSKNEKASSEIGNPFMHGKVPSKSQGVERGQLSETSQVVSTSSHAGSSSSRPSSNYGSRSQQLIGPQKVGPGKEWKLKPTNPNVVQASGTIVTSDIPVVTVETNTRSLPESSATSSEVTTLKLQKKLEELHFSDGQHVIIPNHLQVPEAERTGLSFGSFDTGLSFGSFDSSFGVTTSFTNGPNSGDSSTVSESSQVFEETAEEPSSSNQNASPTIQEDYPDLTHSPAHIPKSLSSGEADISSDIPPVPEYDQSKPEAAASAGGPQYSVHTAPNYPGFGLMPPMLGTQFAPFEGSEPQARDVSRIPSFVVQQPFDPSSSYYTQFYRPGIDGDGRFSPLHAPGATTKYNGNIAAQTGQSAQENGNSLVLSAAGPTPLATQPAGVTQSSIPVTQQQVPYFRQPAGVHISHYPPNIIPYSQYFSQFYVPPPTIHQFLGNPAFPQQPPAGSIYPPLAAPAATSVKYYKPGTSTVSSTLVGVSTSYGPYGSAPAGYSPTPVVTMGNSSGNEETQYKENNVYLTGQQSEGSGVWIHAPVRDISGGLQANSFYNLPQGQQLTFAPPFPAIYPPAQALAPPLLPQSQTMAGGVEMVGPPAAVYQQQPQRAQINWANNY
ncbi:uncharacterized protein LOC143851971 isoform X2 [Tasmannia lanceolata]|uniref:uncharacterized protein LOC143851971 isoform X2 n=1 Tax=Tasmannia lanceolata TaxID=3420 RepID=UPI004063E49C